MSGSFDPAADAAVIMSAGTAGAAGTGAHTVAVLWKSAPLNPNSGLLSLYASSTQVRQLLTDSGELFGTGDFSSGYPSGGVGTDTWYVGAITKPAGSAHYRCHLWPYASDGSGAMDHGEAPDAANHGDGSSITEIRIGLTDTRGSGLIAVVAVWDSELSDANLNTLRSGSLTAWSALSPKELISLENWNGTTGASAVVGTSTQSSLTGTVSVGANPPGFSFALTSAAASSGAQAVPPPLLYLLAARSQAMWQAGVSGTQIDAQTGQTSAAAATTGTAVKLASVTGRCAGSAVAHATAAKAAAQTGTAATAARTSGTAAKVGPQTGSAATATRTSGAAAKKVPQTGTAAAVATSTGNLGARAATGRTFAAGVSAATAVKVASIGGRCAAAAVARAAAAKLAAPQTTAAAAAMSRATVVKRATPSSATLAATSCRGAAQKRAVPPGPTYSTAACAGFPVKRAQPGGRTFAVVVALQVDVTRSVVGYLWAAAASFPRPNPSSRPGTGTTGRPDSGGIARPYSGVIHRP